MLGLFKVPHLEPNPLDPFRLPTISVTFEVPHDSPHLIPNPVHFLRIGLVTALVADLAGLLGCVVRSPRHRPMGQWGLGHRERTFFCQEIHGKSHGKSQQSPRSHCIILQHCYS